MAGPSSCFFLLERIDQLYGREEPDLAAMVLDSLDAKGGGNMGLPGARATDKHDVLRPVHELAAVQLTHCRLIHLAG